MLYIICKQNKSALYYFSLIGQECKVISRKYLVICVMGLGTQHFFYNPDGETVIMQTNKACL